MSVEVFDVNAAPISITPAAVRHLLKQLALSGKKGIRLSVKESGCTGFMYVLDEVDEGQVSDITIQEDALTFWLDPESLPIIRGTQLDFVFEGLNRVLKFNNPNVTAACGCGESFSVEEGVSYS
jgi:iron-sulfur cluster assembly accessory protein